MKGGKEGGREEAREKERKEKKEKERLLSKNTIPSKVVLQKLRSDKDFLKQTEAQGIHHH